jgi:hypothetical protein
MSSTDQRGSDYTGAEPGYGTGGVPAADGRPATEHAAGGPRVDQHAESGAFPDHGSAAGAPAAGAPEAGAPEAGAPVGGAPVGGAANARPADGSSGQPLGPSGKLIDTRNADDYRARWDQLKGQFVDQPRDAVHSIDGLVGDVLEELQRVFREQRQELERGIGDDNTSTEDLRVAFGRYREFFERLLSL